MPPKKKGNKGFKDDAEALLQSLGVTGSLRNLVRKAILGDWSLDEFAAHLVATRAFRQKFPGLIDRRGRPSQDFFSSGFSASSLMQATSTFNRGYDDFKNVAQRLGIKAPSRKMFGLAVNNDISLEEFGVRAQAIQAVQSNPGLLDAFNEELKYNGEKPLDKQGFYQMVAGAAAPKFYDTYQAAYLRKNLGLSQEDARTAAQGIDSSLKPNMDLGKLVSEIQRVRVDIGPELAQAGISDVDITLLAAGNDPKGIGGTLESILNNRRAKARGGPGTYSRQTATGGLALYDEEEPGSY